MIILGIDPGLATVGWGVISTDGSRHKALAYGSLITPPGVPLEDRLLQIATETEAILDKYKPEAMAVEELLFNTNITTGIRVAEARGVTLLCGRRKNVPIYEYTPLQVKQAVVGYGRAEKHQVMDMVKRLCALKAAPKPDDAADAVALALCHARSSTSLLYKGDNEECSTI